MTDLCVVSAPQASECTWSCLILSHPPPRCLADIPDSVSSLRLRLLSGQLGLKQHDPRSAVQAPTDTLCVCVYTLSMCVYVRLSMCYTHACLRYKRCHIHKILTEKQATKWGNRAIFGKISILLCFLCIFYVFLQNNSRNWEVSSSTINALVL